MPRNRAVLACWKLELTVFLGEILAEVANKLFGKEGKSLPPHKVLQGVPSEVHKNAFFFCAEFRSQSSVSIMHIYVNVQSNNKLQQ
jgi:hypothetical protein